MNKLNLVKWHIYSEFVLVVISFIFSLSLIGSINNNPLLKMLLPKSLLIINIVILLVLSIWLGFISYIMHKSTGN